MASIFELIAPYAAERRRVDAIAVETTEPEDPEPSQERAIALPSISRPNGIAGFFWDLTFQPHTDHPLEGVASTIYSYKGIVPPDAKVDLPEISNVIVKQEHGGYISPPVVEAFEKVRIQAIVYEASSTSSPDL